MKPNFQTSRPNCVRFGDADGFSLIELIIVVVIIGILATFAIPLLSGSKKLYKSEDQALRIMDMMREGAQIALTKRKTIRLEVDLTDNKVLFIDENGAGASDDRELKALPLESTAELRVDVKPTGINKPNPPNYNDATFATDTIGHLRGSTTISGHNIWAARFQSDGSVVNSAGVAVNANLYIFAPQSSGSTTAKENKLVRAITLSGASGAVRYWRHNGTTFVAY